MGGTGLPAPPSNNNQPGAGPGTAAELSLKVDGIGALLGLPWGEVTIATAISGFKQLAAQAAQPGATGSAAAARLAQIQYDLYLAGFYGTKQPAYGSLSGGELDITAFEKAMVDAANSKERAGQYLSSRAASSTQAGTSSVTSYAAPHEQQTTFSPADIQATADQVGQNLLGRRLTADEMGGVLKILNNASAANTSAQVSADQAVQTADAQAGAQKGVTAYDSKGNIIASPTITPQEVAAQIAAYGGSRLQQQVGAALVSGIESNGDPRVLAGGKGPAAGLFQFEPQTWQSNGGGQYANVAQNATWQQQVAVFVNATRGDHFGAWGPDLGAAYGYGGPPKPGSKVANAIAKLDLGNTSATTIGGTAFSAPVGPGLTQGRVDQGIDWSGSGPVLAVGSGKIISVKNAGWPGGTFIALKLDNPPDPQHSVVYYAEDIAAQVKIGQHVGAGSQLGTATGGQHGIEIGWADPKNIGQALAAGQYKEGVPTPEGQHFLSYISGGSGGGGGDTGKSAIYPSPVVTDVPNIPSAQEAATNFVETQRSPEFQANNLLNVFGTIKKELTPTGIPGGSEHVLNNPVVMK